MNKIPVKQIEGAVDLSSEQTVSGRKHFSSGLTVQNGSTGHFPMLHEGMLYFRRSKTIFQENDFRLGVNASGNVALEQLVGGQWLVSCLNGCSQQGHATMYSFGSVAYGTSITLSSGALKLSEDLQLGDMVRSIADVSSLTQSGLLSAIIYISPATTPAKIIGIQKYRFEYYYRINGSFKISQKHHVLVNRSNVFQFTRVENVVAGDKILHFTNGWTTVTANERINQSIDMVSLKLENYDTYLAQNFVLRTIED